MAVTYRYQTLEDYLVSHPASVDEQLDDGWGGKFPVKGIELEATILFADIAGFSRRTAAMSPLETLIFTNQFLSWISAEAIKDSTCIVDKYIGDAVMLVFSKELGSSNPFIEALQTARWICENDVLSFCPHVGIASGLVMVGYTGTAIKYNASVFGSPVTIANRCASVRSANNASSLIVFPDSEWGSNSISEIFKPIRYEQPDGTSSERPSYWALNEAREIDIKAVSSLLIREIEKNVHHFPQLSAEGYAREYSRLLHESNRVKLRK